LEQIEDKEDVKAMRNVEKEWEKINNDFIADEDLEQYNFDEGV